MTRTLILLAALVAAAPVLHAQSVRDSVRVSYSVRSTFTGVAGQVSCSVYLRLEYPDFAGTGRSGYDYSGLPSNIYWFPDNPPGMIVGEIYAGGQAGGDGEFCAFLIANTQTNGAATVTYAIRSYPEGMPVAKFDTTGSDGLTRGFDGSASFESVAGRRVPVVSHRWTFGDGSAGATGVAPSHTYAEPGRYLVTLEVTDDDGQRDSYSRNVTVARPGLRVWAEAQTADQVYRLNDDVVVVGYIENRSDEAVTDIRVPASFGHSTIYPANAQPFPRQPPRYRRIRPGTDTAPARLDTTIASLGPGERAEIVQVFNVDQHGTYQPSPTGPSVPTRVTGYALLLGVTGRDAAGQTVVGEQRCGLRPCGNTWAVAPGGGLVVNSVDDDADDEDDDECDTGQDVEIDGEMVAECTLRAAIKTANTLGGATVTFAIPSGGVPRIDVPNRLPPLTTEIVLDATTQPGGWIELVGPGQDASGPSIAGLLILGAADGSEVRGFVIHGFREGGVYLGGDLTGCLIEGNRLGTDVTGTVAMGNGHYLGADFYQYGGGVTIESGPSGNRIVGNVIAGNISPAGGGRWVGTDVFMQRADRNVFEGNRIGVGVDGQPLVLPPLATGPYDSYIGIHIIAGDENVIGGPGEVGGAAACASLTCNTIQGHTVEVQLGGFFYNGGPRNVVSGNVIGRRSSQGVPAGAVETTVGISSNRSDETRVAFNYIQSRETGISLHGVDNEILGNTVAADFYDDPGPGAIRDRYAAIRAGADDVVRLNTVSTPWIAVRADQGATITNNTFNAGFKGIVVQSGTPEVFASQNTFSGCNSNAELVHLGGELLNQDGPVRSQRRNDWLDLDGYPNAPVIVRAARSGSEVRVSGYVRPSGPYDIGIEAYTCGSVADNGVFAGAGDVDAAFGVAEFEMTLTDVETEYFAFTATHVGAFTSEATAARVVPAAQISTVNMPSIAPGTSVSGQGAGLNVVGGGRPAAVAGGIVGATAAGAGARLFITRHNGLPAPGPFADTTATAPGGASIRPDAVAARTWLMRDIGLSRESVDPAMGATFDVCFDAQDAVLPEALGVVVVVQRGSEGGLHWQPLPTTLEVRPDGPALCARGLTTLGEFGFGGTSSSFPVGTEDDVPMSSLDRPTTFAMSAYPNPVRRAATVSVSVPALQPVTVSVFDLLGRRVAVLHDGPLAVGTHALRWDAGVLPSGVYVVRATGETSVQTQRVTVVR